MDDTSLELCETFVAESLDYIDELEPQFIALSEALGQGKSAEAQQLMNHIFRLIHTIKGSAGSLGFKNITALAHKAENLLDSVRNHRLTLTSERLDLLTQSLDLFRGLLAILQRQQSDDGTEPMIERMLLLLDNANREERVSAPEAPTAPAMTEVTPGLYIFDEEPVQSPKITITATMRSTFVQESEDSLSKVELALLASQEAATAEKARHYAEALRLLHSFKGNCGFMQLAGMEALAHAMETLLQDIGSAAVDEGRMDELLRSVDVLKLCLGQVAAGNPAVIPSLKELLRQLDPNSDRSAGASESKDKTSVSAQNATLSDIKKSLEQSRGGSPSLSRSDVRVDLKKLDALINLVGELVVAEAMVNGWKLSKGIESEELERAIHHLKRTTLSLQDVAMSVRMVPVNQTFKKMIRLVHDTSAKLGKKVRLNLVGEETEVDKTVIEQIADPLVHCVRNSIDHGLETPDERRGSKKDETGTITLEARHEGGEVWVIIRDDGKGLNREKILARAKERGLVSPEREASLSDADVYNFIFEPGFSTAEKVTDISGRGVGMDVVRKNIEKVKGRIRVDSTPGEGTRVVFQIPLTLAIIDGMMIRIGNSKYTIPLLAIQESIRVRPKQITVGPDGTEMLDVRSNFIPIVRLDDLENKQRLDKTLDRMVVVVEVNNRCIAIMVDEILGQQQTVIKALPAIYKHSRNVSGCSILGNGEVSLILDVAGIAESIGGTGATGSSLAA